jgi:hypothetical protein
VHTISTCADKVLRLSQWHEAWLAMRSTYSPAYELRRLYEHLNGKLSIHEKDVSGTRMRYFQAQKRSRWSLDGIKNELLDGRGTKKVLTSPRWLSYTAVTRESLI